VPLIGEDNIMWASDYPHPDSLWPDSHRVVDENLAGFSPAVRRKIVCDNAARLYGLN
jgi:predicted TIM-barrel fold metal-dependent hydrolase